MSTPVVNLEDLDKLDALPPEAREEKVVDGAELEKEMLAAEAKKAQKFDPEETAAMFLTFYTPRFCGLVDKLSNRQLRRLVKSLIEYPIGKQYNHNDSIESEAFKIGNSLMDAKYVLIANTYNENREKIFEEAAKAAANIETSFTEPEEKEVVNNG